MVKNIIVGITATPIALSTLELIKVLKRHYSIEVVCTKKALQFVNKIDILTECAIHPYMDDDSPNIYVELIKKADCLLIAPCTANTLAKMANGICDNLLTTIIRNWDYNYPIIIVPSMSTQVWESPITYGHIRTITNLIKNVFFTKLVPDNQIINIEEVLAKIKKLFI